LAAFKEFRSTGVVVFANSRTEWTSMPPGAASLRSQGGGTIPMVFVTTADGGTGIEAIPYAKLKDDIRKADRELRRKLEGVDVLATNGAPSPSAGDDGPAPGEPGEEADVLLAPSQAWTNVEGKTITAGVAKLGADSVTFAMPDGKHVDYPLERLSPESRDRLGKLADAR
jgi:hypothetical protein